MKKRIGTILSLTLATTLVFGGVTSRAAFNAGEATKSFTYSGKSGTVSVMADVTGSSSGTYYKYKGDIYYPTDTKLNVYVKGYYSSNGSVRAVTNEKTVTSAKTATAYAYVPDGCAGVCSSSNKSSAKGTVKSTEVATAKYPS